MEYLNKEFGIDMINHNAQDAWTDDIKRALLGLRKNSTAYMPTGKAIALRSEEDIIEFCKEVLNVDLKKLYRIKD